MQSVIGKRHRPLAIFDDLLITYHVGCISSLKLVNTEEKDIYRLQGSKRDIFFAWSRLYERLLRKEIRAAIKLDDDHLIYIYNKTIYNFSLSARNNQEELKLRSGTSSPYYFCNIKDVAGFKDGIAFGEYVQNNDRSEKIGIYRRLCGVGEWHRVYEFPAGVIRHIHGMVSAPDHKCVYILTGDKDNEAGIWKATNDFESVEPFLVGSQQNRAVHMYVVGNRLIYATDTPNEENYIYSVDVKEGTIDRLVKINGSCIYASESKSYIFVSSTVEPDERICGWKSWINYKLGPGILNRDVCVYRIRKDNLRIDKVATFKKDALPYKLFQYGQCETLYDEERGQLLIYPIAVKKYDGRIIAQQEEDRV